jgi:hypothetical protein
MADWSRHFDEPIVLPGGRQLLTLEDAGTKLPKAEHQAPNPGRRLPPRRSGTRALI